MLAQAQVNGTLPSGDEGYFGLQEGNGSGVKGEVYIGLAAMKGRGVTLNPPDNLPCKLCWCDMSSQSFWMCRRI